MEYAKELDARNNLAGRDQRSSIGENKVPENEAGGKDTDDERNGRVVPERDMAGNTRTAGRITTTESRSDESGFSDAKEKAAKDGGRIDNGDRTEQNKNAAASGAEKLQGMSVENKTLGRIDIDENGLVSFTGSGKREMKSTSAKEHKLLLVKHLPQLIETTTDIASSRAIKERHAYEMF